MSKKFVPLNQNNINRLESGNIKVKDLATELKMSLNTLYWKIQKQNIKVPKIWYHIAMQERQEKYKNCKIKKWSTLTRNRVGRSVCPICGGLAKLRMINEVNVWVHSITCKKD